MNSVIALSKEASGNINNNTIRKIKITILSIIMAVFMLGNSMTVFAMTGSELQEYVNTYGISHISTSHVHITIPTGSSYTSITYNGTTYYVDADGMAEAEAHLNSFHVQQQNTANITSQIQSLDTGIMPDLDGASKAISGFVPAINFLLGFAVTVLTIGMTLLTACDLCYIVFPVIRGKCEDMKAEGKGVSKSRTQKSGQTKLAFVSDEAEYAINAAETTQTGKNPVLIYFKKRAVAIIALSVVIFILLTGNLSVITDIAIKAASGIIDLIGEMGA